MIVVVAIPETVVVVPTNAVVEEDNTIVVVGASVTEVRFRRVVVVEPAFIVDTGLSDMMVLVVV